MNGDAKQIFDAVQEVKLEVREIKTKQEERHFENTKKVDLLFKKVEEFATRTCPVNPNVTRDIKRLYNWVWLIAVSLIGVAIGHLMDKF